MKRLLIALMAAVLLSTSGCVTVMNVDEKPAYDFFLGNGGMLRVNRKTGEAWFLTPYGWTNVEDMARRQPQIPGTEIR